MRHLMSVKPDPAAARKVLTAMRMAKCAIGGDLPRLLYLTDSNRSPNPVSTASALPPGSAVIYRHFGLQGREKMAFNLRAVTIRRQVQLLIANDPLLAMAVNADGVHWPQTSMHKAKRWRNKFQIMTASAHSRAALHEASLSFVDAALLSTVFKSDSPTASAPIGASKFRDLANGAKIPVYALGGVTAHNAQQVTRAGGIAAISGIESVFGA